ncbi:hypothetical protein ACU5AY_00295 [Rhizobium sp. PAMB 3174]
MKILLIAKAKVPNLFRILTKLPFVGVVPQAICLMAPRWQKKEPLGSGSQGKTGRNQTIIPKGQCPNPVNWMVSVMTYKA